MERRITPPTAPSPTLQNDRKTKTIPIATATLPSSPSTHSLLLPPRPTNNATATRWLLFRTRWYPRNTELFLLLISIQLVVMTVSFCCSQHKLAYSDFLASLSSSKTIRGFTPMVEDPHGLPNVRYGCRHANTSKSEHDEQFPPIQLHIIAWQRPLRTLLQQLQHADYTGYNSQKIPLYIHLDGNASKVALDDAHAALWTHGELHVLRSSTNKGLRSMWLDSMRTASRQAANNNTVLIVLEDDVHVSPAFFQWTLAVLTHYALSPRCRDHDLVGFSLSPIKLQEMKKPFTRWDAQEAMGIRNNNFHRHLAYLAAVPSSWGAAYFSDQWNRFEDFVALRSQVPFYNTSEELRTDIQDYGEYRMSPSYLHVPQARSNVWPKSWKRFMVDFMVARGLVMLYPNLPGEVGFATALQQDGEHVGKKTTYKNPRVAELVAERTLDFEATGHLPRYGDLAVFDLFLRPTTKEELALQGEQFLATVQQQCGDLCSELLQVWAEPHILRRINNTRNSGGAQDPLTSLLFAPYGSSSTGSSHSQQRGAQRHLGCIADHYTSTAAAVNRLPPPTSTRETFLLFEPQYGANNQLHALVEAFFWAKALHRRLVIPPLFMPRVSAHTTHRSTNSSSHDVGGVPMERFFFLTDFRSTTQATLFDREALTPISFEDFSQHVTDGLVAAPWRILRVTRSAIFDGSARTLTQHYNLPTVSLRPYFDDSISVEKLQESLGGCDDQVLTFDGLFYAGLKGVDVRGVMPDVLRTSANVDRLYRSVERELVKDLGSSQYACFHVRIGDFVDMCATMANKESSASQQIPSSYLRTFSQFSCTLSPEEVAEFIRQKGYPAFVMSDSPEKLRETLNGLPVKAVSSDWTANTIRTHLGAEVSDHDLQVLSLLIDQRLCADSSYAFLNRFSTVSQRVLSLRRRRDFEYFKPM